MLSLFYNLIFCVHHAAHVLNVINPTTSYNIASLNVTGRFIVYKVYRIIADTNLKVASPVCTITFWPCVPWRAGDSADSPRAWYRMIMMIQWWSSWNKEKMNKKSRSWPWHICTDMHWQPLCASAFSGSEVQELGRKEQKTPAASVWSGRVVWPPWCWGWNKTK